MVVKDVGAATRIYSGTACGVYCFVVNIDAIVPRLHGVNPCRVLVYCGSRVRADVIMNFSDDSYRRVEAGTASDASSVSNASYAIVKNVKIRAFYVLYAGIYAFVRVNFAIIRPCIGRASAEIDNLVGVDRWGDESKSVVMYRT